MAAMPSSVRTDQRQEARARGRINRQFLKTQRNICTGKQGLQRQVCLMELRKMGSYSENRIAPRYLSPPESRRTAALRERARRQRSVLVPSITGKYERINLQKRIPRLPLQSNITIYQQKSSSGFLLRTRAKAGLRKVGTSGRSWNPTRQLCSGRKGIRLINCLIELRIEINDRTADRGTLDIWLQMQK